MQRRAPARRTPYMGIDLLDTDPFRKARCFPAVLS
jgi:hypothetical protein